jgi:hypothetical protein
MRAMKASNGCLEILRFNSTRQILRLLQQNSQYKRHTKFILNYTRDVPFKLLHTPTAVYTELDCCTSFIGFDKQLKPSTNNYSQETNRRTRVISLTSRVISLTSRCMKVTDENRLGTFLSILAFTKIRVLITIRRTSY